MRRQGAGVRRHLTIGLSALRSLGSESRRAGAVRITIEKNNTAIKMTPEEPAIRTLPTKRKGRRILIASAAVALILLGLPWVLAKTSLRDRLLTSIANSDEIVIQSQDASFGYLAPLALSGLRVESRDKVTVIEVDHIEADRSWLGLLFSRPELGVFRFDRPKVDIHMQLLTSYPDLQPNQVDKSIDLPMLAAMVRDASVVVRTSESGEPPIDVEQVSVTLRLEREHNQSVLRIDPTTVFDHQRLTPELCGRGLQLIAPLLADEIAAEGEFSLRLQEFYVPLGKTGPADKSAIRIRGELELHQASVGLKNTIVSNVIDLIVKLFRDSRPETMTVAQDVNVRFQVVDGRVHHQGLALLLPRGESSIEVISNGSVGLDESLDLLISIYLPVGMLGESALAKTLTNDAIVVAVHGTFDNPEIGLPNKANWIHSIEGLLSPSGDGSSDDGSSDDALQEALGDILDGLLERAANREPILNEPILKEPIFPRLRQRLRDRRRPKNDLPTDTTL